MERAGFLDKLVSSVLAKAKSGGALVATAIGTAIGLNIIAADQYIAIVLPSRMFLLEFKRRGYKPTVLSRTVEDSGTVTSVLIPWNTCGAYHTGCWAFRLCVLPVLLLQYHQSHLVIDIRIHGLPHGEVRAR